MNINHEFKVELHQFCKSLLHEKRSVLKGQISARKMDLETASKSSAGDKHETSRAMIHLEQEKLGFQYVDLEKQIQSLSQIHTRITDSIHVGSLIETDKALFYISIGLGKLCFNGIDVYVISPVSPLAQAFLKTDSLEDVLFKSTSYKILSIT